LGSKGDMRGTPTVRPLYPLKQTFLGAASMSAGGQNQPIAQVWRMWLFRKARGAEPFPQAGKQSRWDTHGNEMATAKSGLQL
jgi:hypothetical protein